MRDSLYKAMTDFLMSEGVGDMSHTGKTYIGHLLAVHRLLDECGFGTDVCRAGLFHSIYGTEEFSRFQLPLDRRSELRSLIGERAERLAYLNCAMDRASFDATLGDHGPSFHMRDRFTGESVSMSREDYDDLCRVHLYDWLEQVPRSRRGYGYRREPYRRMAERLGPTAVADFERIYAAESKPL
jgi:hypothetical protein